MQLGMVGRGRMGAKMVQRLLKAGCDCVVHDARPEAAEPLRAQGARPARSLRELVAALEAPRAVWLMVPTAGVDASLAELAPLLERDDVVVDGGNSHYHDDLRREKGGS